MLSTLTYSKFRGFLNKRSLNESVAMDVPEPDQTPFNAVQAQTSKLARVGFILLKQCRDMNRKKKSLRSENYLHNADMWPGTFNSTDASHIL